MMKPSAASGRRRQGQRFRERRAERARYRTALVAPGCGRSGYSPEGSRRRSLRQSARQMQAVRRRVRQRASRSCRNEAAHRRCHWPELTPLGRRRRYGLYSARKPPAVPQAYRRHRQWRAGWLREGMLSGTTSPDWNTNAFADATSLRSSRKSSRHRLVLAWRSSGRRVTGIMFEPQSIKTDQW